MKRVGKVKISWSPNFAYAIGLITTDGNLSKDNRHINFTTKDNELALIFKKCLSLENKIGRKSRGGSVEKKYYVVQFGDVNFYEFLVSLGLKQAKSKTLKEINLPKEFISDFLRGCIDGDGNISITSHPESQKQQLRLRLCSASRDFLIWVKDRLAENLNIQGGWIYKSPKSSVSVLTYAKGDAIQIFHYIYYDGVESYLKRKFILAKQFMS